MPVPAVYPSAPFPPPDYEPALWLASYVTYTSPRGRVAVLTGDPSAPASIFMPDGPNGWDMPDFDLQWDESPGMDGGRFRSIRTVTRELAIPVYLKGIDRRSLVLLKQHLFRALDPRAGQGRLTVTEGDGTRRYLACRYVSGAEGEETRDNAGFTWVRYVLVLRALDPFWYAAHQYQHDWAPSASPIPTHDAQLRVDGDVETWPVWRITGPATRIALVHLETGHRIAFKPTLVLHEGDMLAIDTRPGVKTLVWHRRGGAVINAWRHLETGTRLWALFAGTDPVRLSLQDPGPSTLVRLTWQPRYFSYTG